MRSTAWFCCNGLDRRACSLSALLGNGHGGGEPSLGPCRSAKVKRRVDNCYLACRQALVCISVRRCARHRRTNKLVLYTVYPVPYCTCKVSYLYFSVNCRISYAASNLESRKFSLGIYSRATYPPKRLLLAKYTKYLLSAISPPTTIPVALSTVLLTISSTVSTTVSAEASSSASSLTISLTVSSTVSLTISSTVSTTVSAEASSSASSSTVSLTVLSTVSLTVSAEASSSA